MLKFMFRRRRCRVHANVVHARYNLALAPYLEPLGMVEDKRAQVPSFRFDYSASVLWRTGTWGPAHAYSLPVSLLARSPPAGRPAGESWPGGRAFRDLSIQIIRLFVLVERYI